MNKGIYNLIALLMISTFTSNTWGDEFVESKFNGLQLAWARAPSGKAEAETVVAPQPKQQVKPAATQPVKPATTVSTPPPAAKFVAPVEVAPVPVARSEYAPTFIGRQLPSFDWLIGVGFDGGGDDLGLVTYSDGRVASVQANSGIVLNMGGIVANGQNSAFSTQLSIAYKSGGPGLWNRDVNWTAIPLEVIEHYRSRSLRLGLGLSYQLNPQLKVSLPTASLSSKYNNAIGLIAQVGWMPVRKNYSIDLRYTAINYQLSGVPSAPRINGNVAGLYVTYYY